MHLAVPLFTGQRDGMCGQDVAMGCFFLCLKLSIEIRVTRAHPPELTTLAKGKKAGRLTSR